MLQISAATLESLLTNGESIDHNFTPMSLTDIAFTVTFRLQRKTGEWVQLNANLQLLFKLISKSPNQRFKLLSFK